MLNVTDVVVGLGNVTVGPPLAIVDDVLVMLPGDGVLFVGNHEFVKNGLQPTDYGFGAA